MVTRSARQALVLTALTSLVVGIAGCAGSGSGVAGSSTVVSQSAVALPSTPEASTSRPAAGPSSAPFSGYVQQIYSTGDFLLVSGPVTYTVVMLPTTTVVNIRGQRVPRQYIAVSGLVDVTGTLDTGTITAQSVLVPTRKDDA